MELNLIISGVPNGEDYWGPSEDALYFRTLYTTSQENAKFDIRLRHNSQGGHLYYHYLVYNIVNNSSGRTGSYIGLTLRLDSYCEDFLTIYQLLDMVFRKNVVSVLIKEVNGGRLQYVVDSFGDKKAEIKKLEENITNTLGLLLKTNDIIQISSVSQSEGIEKINLNEASKEYIKQSIIQRKVGCSLSLEYRSKREIILLQEEFQKGFLSCQPDLDRLKNQLTETRGTIDSLNCQMGNLNSQNVQLKKAVEQIQLQKNNLERSLRNNTVGYIPCAECHNNNNNDNKSDILMRYFRIMFYVFCLLALAYLLYCTFLIKEQRIV